MDMRKRYDVHKWADRKAEQIYVVLGSLGWMALGGLVGVYGGISRDILLGAIALGIVVMFWEVAGNVQYTLKKMNETLEQLRNHLEQDRGH